MLSIVKLSLAVLAATQLATADSVIEARQNGCAAAGAVNGQCGRYYTGKDCGNTLITQFKPDCSGRCITDTRGILSVKATGDGTFGTDCELYEDANCRQPIGRTGNTIFSWNQKCHNAPNGKVGRSLKCWYRC
ncbi:hypothetical protein PspLS_11371 [Pyricularia sp. CBS 133598]|nr:hypothetical protein PspLS_11371 [Pyricularia sp. CBS 133598]